MNRFTAMGALLCVATSTPAFAECSASDRAALQAFDVAWTKASNSGDRAALTTMLSDNFGSTNIVGAVNKAGSIDNTVRNAALNATNPQPQATADHFAFVCSAALATIMHRNTNAAVAPATYPTYSRTIHVLEKKGNSWQVVTSMNHALTDQQTLIYMEQDWNDAWKNRDVAWIEKNYASFSRDVDAVTGGLMRKDDTIADMKKSANTYESLELSDLGVRVEGDVAVVSGVNTVKGKDAQGKAIDRKTRFTDTFIRRDGQWQVWATQGTLIK
jgi:ketosteroid isomerase-like protein